MSIYTSKSQNVSSHLVCFIPYIHFRVSCSCYLFADAAPGVVEDGVLVARHRGVQLLEDDLDTPVAMHKTSDMVHHGSFTVHAGALVRRPVSRRERQSHSEETRSIAGGIIMIHC